MRTSCPTKITKTSKPPGERRFTTRTGFCWGTNLSSLSPKNENGTFGFTLDVSRILGQQRLSLRPYVAATEAVGRSGGGGTFSDPQCSNPPEIGRFVRRYPFPFSKLNVDVVAGMHNDMWSRSWDGSSPGRGSTE